MSSTIFRVDFDKIGIGGIEGFVGFWVWWRLVMVLAGFSDFW
jgi:hypothetical protein